MARITRNVYIKDDKLDEWIRKKVEAGRFRSYSHAVEVALKLLREKEEARPAGAF